jgi:hypothetical protein
MPMIGSLGSPVSEMGDILCDKRGGDIPPYTATRTFQTLASLEILLRISLRSYGHNIRPLIDLVLRLERPARGCQYTK